eukprot:6304630-Prymnesium_polylepis.1
MSLAGSQICSPRAHEKGRSGGPQGRQHGAQEIRGRQTKTGKPDKGACVETKTSIIWLQDVDRTAPLDIQEGRIKGWLKARWDNSPPRPGRVGKARVGAR